LRGYSYLIENNVVNVDMTLFKEFIDMKIGELEPIEESKNTGFSAKKKTHTISKEMLIELPYEDPNVKIPYAYIERKKKKIHFRYESKPLNFKMARSYKYDFKSRIFVILDCLSEC
jgi:hypothetical protein